MTISLETVMAVSAIVVAILGVASYLGNKIGKAQQAKSSQREHDYKQDEKINRVETSQSTLWRRQDESTQKIEKLREGDKQMAVLSTKLAVLSTKFESFEKAIEVLQVDIKILVANRGE